MSLKRKIWEGTFFISKATLQDHTGTFLANGAMIRTLSQELVGQLGLIESWLSLIGIFASLGLSVAVTKYLPEYLETDRHKVGSVAGTSIVLTILLSGFGVLVAAVGFRVGLLGVTAQAQKVLSAYSLWFFGLIVTANIRQILSAILYGFQSFRVFIMPNIVVGLLSVPATYFLVKWRSLHGALEARMFLTLVESLLLMYALFILTKRLQIRFSVHGFVQHSRELLGFGIPNCIGQVGVTPVQSAFMSLLAAQPGGLNQLGLLTTANRLCALANFLPGSMASTLIPVLAGEWGKGRRESFRDGTLTAIRMLWIICIPIVLFFLVLSPNLLVWLYGEQYRGAWPIAFGLLLVVFLASVNETADRALAAAGRVWLSTANKFVWAALFAGMAIWFVPRFQAIGYTGAFLVSFAAYVGLQLWWVRRLFETDLSALRSLLWLSLALVVPTALIANVSNPALQIILAALMILSALFILWTKILAASERQALLGQISRACGVALGYSGRALRFLKP